MKNARAVKVRDNEEAKKKIRQIDDEKGRLIARFVNSKGQKFSCRYGFEIRLNLDGDRPAIGISLDHLEKQKIIGLTKSGELTNELLFLYELAHLPFSLAYRMHLLDKGIDVYIVDRVLIEFGKAFNIYDKDEWAKHDSQAFWKANDLDQMYWETEPFYSKLKKGMAK